MRPHHSLLVLVLSCGLAASVLRADSKHGPPAATSADVAAAKASIDALASGPVRDLTVAIGRVGTRLDGLESAVKALTDGLGKADLPELARQEAAANASLATLSDRHAALEVRLGAAEDKMNVAAAAARDAGDGFERRLAADERELQSVSVQSRDLSAELPREINRATGAAAASQMAASERVAGTVGRYGLAAASGLLLVVALVAWWGARRRLALQSETLLAITRLGSEMRQGTMVAAARASAQDAPTLTAEWSDLEQRLRRLAERWERQSEASLIDTLRPDSLAGNRGRIPPLANSGPNGIHSAGADEALPSAEQRPSERPTVSVSLHGEPSVASRLLWPDEFLDPQSPLSRWRFLLESHFEDGEHPALPVLAGLLGLRAALGRPVAHANDIGIAAFQLSESLHAYWRSLADLTGEDRQQASAAWLRSMRGLIGPAAPRLELREVLPGARVDPDLMHATREGPGNRLNVAEVFSWAVVDRSGDRPRVLHRARIATT